MIAEPRTDRRRLRVGHVVLQLRTGGMEKLLVELARHTDRRRFDLRFVCLGEREGLAADIESGWSVQVPGRGFEIKRSIFAQSRQ